MTDIIDTIDQAIGCQQCGGALGESPSDDYCGEVCQRTWMGQNALDPGQVYRGRDYLACPSSQMRWQAFDADDGAWERTFAGSTPLMRYEADIQRPDPAPRTLEATSDPSRALADGLGFGASHFITRPPT